MPSQVNPEAISTYEVDANALRRQLAIIRDELNELRAKAGIDEAPPPPVEEPPPEGEDTTTGGAGNDTTPGGTA